jgi:hypothetical protein
MPDAATTAWVNAVVTNGGAVSAGRQTTIDNFIVGAKADGFWTKLDLLWFHFGEDGPSSLTDLKSLTLAVAHGSPAWAASRGYTGVDSSTTVYIDSGVNLSTYGGQFTTNSGHLSSWSNTNTVSSASGGCLFGVSDSSVTANLVTIIPMFADGNAYMDANFSAIAPAGVAVTDSMGHHIANRSSSSTTQGYKNGIDIGVPTQTVGTLPNANLSILGDNDTTSGRRAGSACQVAMTSIGASLTATDAANFYNRLLTCIKAVGVPVMGYLSPDADSVAGGWINETGGRLLNPSIGEPVVPNDATFIRSSGNPPNDICRVSLSNPGGVVTQPFNVSYRYGKSGTDLIDITVTLKQGSSIIASWVHTNVSA